MHHFSRWRFSTSSFKMQVLHIFTYWNKSFCFNELITCAVLYKKIIRLCSTSHATSGKVHLQRVKLSVNSVRLLLVHKAEGENWSFSGCGIIIELRLLIAITVGVNDMRVGGPASTGVCKPRPLDCTGTSFWTNKVKKILLLKMDYRRTLFVHLSSFQTKILQKNCVLQWDSNSDRRSKGAKADHLTTTPRP